MSPEFSLEAVIEELKRRGFNRDPFWVAEEDKGTLANMLRFFARRTYVIVLAKSDPERCFTGTEKVPLIGWADVTSIDGAENHFVHVEENTIEGWAKAAVCLLVFLRLKGVPTVDAPRWNPPGGKYGGVVAVKAAEDLKKGYALMFHKWSPNTVSKCSE